MRNHHLLFMGAFFVTSLLAGSGHPYNNQTPVSSMKKADKNIYRDGGIVRFDTTKKEIALVFTAADKADGAKAIIATLNTHQIKGGFFLTGAFYTRFPEVVAALKSEGHYVGAHSYAHPLYCDWSDRNKTLITREDFFRDLEMNYELMHKAGIPHADAPYFMPPYEHYNAEISEWTRLFGLHLVNYTPGTWTNGDYTTPDMKNYRSSKDIYDKVMEVEEKEGLNGHIMLVHLGTDDRRTDKFYNDYLDKMIVELVERGYAFVSLHEALGL